MLYTIVPLEEIFQADCTANFETISLENSYLQIDKTGTVQRLISTDPADYLNPSYQPNQPSQK